MATENSKKIIFTWRIQNFIYSHHDKKQKMFSPKFIWQIDKKNKTTWRLYLTPRSAVDGEYVECYLQLCESDVGSVQANFRFEVVGLYGNVIVNRSSTKERLFDSKDNWGFQEIFSRTQLTSNASPFLTNGTLVIRCEISANFDIIEICTDDDTKCAITDSTEQVNISDRCLACTEIQVDVLRDIHRIQVSENHFTSFIICSNECAVLSMRFKLNVKEKEVFIEVQQISESTYSKSAFCTFKILIYDSSGNTQHCGKYEHFFSDDVKVWKIIFRPINYDSLLNELITLNSKFKISRGTELSQVEYVSGKHTFETKKNEDRFKNSILSMYKEKTSCDFTIVSADGEELKAHKCVLQARSLVFHKMLRFDSKELQENRVEIQDADSQTLDLLLRYIYSSYPEDYKTGVAMKVYAAADKYEMLNLKQHCSALMIAKLDLSNVFDVLKLADLYSDIVLESFVKTFIIENAVRVFESNEWESIEDENLNLASRISKWVAIEQTKKLNT